MRGDAAAAANTAVRQSALRRTLALVLLLLGGLSAPTLANDEPALVVGGEARLSTVPDLARVDLAVVTRAPTASAALAANNEAMQALQALLRQDFGLAPQDLATSQLHLLPHFGPAGVAAPEPQGYEVQHGLQLTVRAFDRLGALLDAAVRGGANQLRGIGFDTTRRQEMTDAARRAAVADARRRAALYAEAAGRRLGCVVSLTEGPGGPEPRLARMAMVMDAAPSAVPVAAGEIEVVAQVQVGFAFGEEDCPRERRERRERREERRREGAEGAEGAGDAAGAAGAGE